MFRPIKCRITCQRELVICANLRYLQEIIFCFLQISPIFSDNSLSPSLSALCRYAAYHFISFTDFISNTIGKVIA
jgi:hypothetical protein